MILVGVILGAAYGAFVARRLDGNRLDIAHYAGIYALVFGLLSVLLRIGLDRLVF